MTTQTMTNKVHEVPLSYREILSLWRVTYGMEWIWYHDLLDMLGEVRSVPSMTDMMKLVKSGYVEQYDARYKFRLKEREDGVHN